MLEYKKEQIIEIPKTLKWCSKCSSFKFTHEFRDNESLCTGCRAVVITSKKVCKGCQSLQPIHKFQLRRGIRSNYCTECRKSKRIINKKQKKWNHSIITNIPENKRISEQLENGETFKSRNIILQEIGYKEYSLYLQSNLWYSIRNSVFKINGRECVLCGNCAQLIHHRKYDKATLLGETLEHLVPLCNDCHFKVEFMPGGEKTNHQKSEMIFKELLVARQEEIFQKIKKARSKYQFDTLISMLDIKINRGNIKT